MALAKGEPRHARTGAVGSRRGRVLERVIFLALLVGCTVLFTAPFLWLISASLKTARRGFFLGLDSRPRRLGELRARLGGRARFVVAQEQSDYGRAGGGHGGGKQFAGRVWLCQLPLSPGATCSSVWYWRP